MLDELWLDCTCGQVEEKAERRDRVENQIEGRVLGYLDKRGQAYEIACVTGFNESLCNLLGYSES